MKFVYVPFNGQVNALPLLEVEAENRVEAKRKLREHGLKDDPDFIDGEIEERDKIELINSFK